MSCRELEPLIALYPDLEARDARRVDAHVAGCGECRQLLEELRANQSLLRELGSEPVGGGLLAAVRAGVMARIGERQRARWPWAAGLAAAAAMAGFLITPHSKTVEQPPAAPRRVVIAEQAIEPPPVPVRRRAVKRRAAKPKPEEPLVVKMLTDDPDIVIIWLVDRQGD